MWYGMCTNTSGMHRRVRCERFITRPRHTSDSSWEDYELRRYHSSTSGCDQVTTLPQSSQSAAEIREPAHAPGTAAAELRETAPAPRGTGAWGCGQERGGESVLNQSPGGGRCAGGCYGLGCDLGCVFPWLWYVPHCISL